MWFRTFGGATKVEELKEESFNIVRRVGFVGLSVIDHGT